MADMIIATEKTFDKDVKESGEMYLETILRLQEGGVPVRSVDIAEAMNFSKPSVSRAVKILLEKNYISLDKHKNILLTETGRAIATAVFKRHSVLTKFFLSLGVTPETAENDACRIEHIISDETFEKLCEKFDTPAV